MPKAKNQKTTQSDEPAVNKGGRPKSEIDWKRLDDILSFGASMIDCEEIIGVSESTVRRAIQKKHGGSFERYRSKKMSKMRLNLLQKQYSLAIENNNVTLLIWLGKNLLGQTDKTEQIDAQTKPIKLIIERPKD